MWVFKQEVLLFKKQKQKQNKTKRKTKPPQKTEKNKQTKKKQCWEVRKSTHRIFCVTYIIISILIM